MILTPSGSGSSADHKSSLASQQLAHYSPSAALRIAENLGSSIVNHQSSIYSHQCLSAGVANPCRSGLNHRMRLVPLCRSLRILEAQSSIINHQLTVINV